jgi:hypothetical protein
MKLQFVTTLPTTVWFTVTEFPLFIESCIIGSRRLRFKAAKLRKLRRAGGLLPGYQSIARYHKDIDAVIIQFMNTSGGYSWSISKIVYNRSVKILKRKGS